MGTDKMDDLVALHEFVATLEPLATQAALRAEVHDLRDDLEQHLMVCPGSLVAVQGGF